MMKELKHDNSFFGWSIGFTDFGEQYDLNILSEVGGEYEYQKAVKIIWNKDDLEIHLLAYDENTWGNSSSDWKFKYKVVINKVTVLVNDDEAVVRNWLDLYKSFDMFEEN